MAKYRDERPLFSLLLQVANPSLIIAMVGSLIFFLIEIFYRGPHVLRLNLIMALFTIATVLISRISIEAGKERAAMFAAGLALATLATTSVVVDFEYQNLAFLEPVVIIFLIVTVMWVSNRLVWDCTLLGRTRDVSAMGLTEAIRQKFIPNKRSEKPKSKKTSPPESFSVFEFMLGRNGKNTTPGLWVFYLAVAAFPIFGAGQWFVNQNSSGFSIFFLFAVYLTSGLGLLMVTSLLGLQRYVNKRGITVPDSVAGNWLFVGSLFLIGLLLIISFLPRPDLSSTMNNYLVLLGSVEETSEMGVGEDNDLPDDEEDANPNAKPKQKPDRERDGDQQAPQDGPVADGKRGDETDPNSSEKKDGGGDKKSDSNSDDGKKNDGKAGQSKDDPGEKGKDGDKQGKKDEGDNAEPQNEDDAKTDQNQDNPKPDKEIEKKELEKEAEEQANQQPNQVGNQPKPPAPPPPALKLDTGSFGWVAYAIVALIALAIIIMYRGELLKMWRQLFGGKKRETETDTEKAPAVNRLPLPPKPFSSFPDPFDSGMASKGPPVRLMEYSFDAMRAWANERGVDVMEHSTADDLVDAIESSMGQRQPEFRSFAMIFNQTIYGDHPPSSSDLQAIKRIWRFMKANSNAGKSTSGQKSTMRS